MRVYTGSDLHEDETLRPVFIGVLWFVGSKPSLPLLLYGKGGGVGFTRMVWVGYSCTQPRLYLYLPILQDLSNGYL
jgi:hypothetical protein